jgi:hypothetical protein
MPATISECPVVWNYLGKKINFSFATSLNVFTIEKSENSINPTLVPQNRITMRNMDEEMIRQRKEKEKHEIIKKEQLKKEKELERIQKINDLIIEFPNIEENGRRLVERDEKEKMFAMKRKIEHAQNEIENKYQNAKKNTDKKDDEEEDYSNVIKLMKNKKI